jgi:ubiquinone/menaquinone biosynthesis C-methylase UbiE
MNQRDLKKYTQDYEKLPFEPILVEYRRNTIIENLKQFPTFNVLEIGCGMEPMFKYFDDYDTMTIVEPTELFFNNACIKAKEFPEKDIRLVNSLFEEAVDRINATKFDFIIISCLLHELSDHKYFLNLLHRVCSNNTIIHINVPNSHSFHRILAVDSGIIKDEFSLSKTQEQMQQTATFNLPLLIELLESQNFEVLDSGSYFLKPFTHLQMQQLIDHKIINDDVLNGLDQIAKRLPGWGAEIFVNIKSKRPK